jgi:serine/threonine protein kinase
VEEAQEYTNKILNDPRLDYFHQLASGLTFLKENGIKFDDLKASNVMEKNGHAAIIDVGYSLIEGNPELPEVEQ